MWGGVVTGNQILEPAPLLGCVLKESWNWEWKQADMGRKHSEQPLHCSANHLPPSPFQKKICFHLFERHRVREQRERQVFLEMCCDLWQICVCETMRQSFNQDFSASQMLGGVVKITILVLICFRLFS